ncbi:hypothetical protein MTO96_003075 [Rhipicephalus appendiculatus]
MEILKKKRKVIWSQVTRFANDADKLLNSASAVDLEEALGVGEESYEAMLYPVLLRALPRELVLNYHRSRTEEGEKDGAATPDPDAGSTTLSSSGSSHRPPLRHLLRFFELELQSRERTQEDRPDDRSGAGRPERQCPINPSLFPYWQTPYQPSAHRNHNVGVERVFPSCALEEAKADAPRILAGLAARISFAAALGLCIKTNKDGRA